MRAHSRDGTADPDVVAAVLRRVLAKRDRPDVALVPAIEAIPPDPHSIPLVALRHLIRRIPAR